VLYIRPCPLPPPSSLNLPSGFSKVAGRKIQTVEDIKKQYAANNITSATTVDLLDMLVQHVYSSTPNTDKTMYACDFNGLTTLNNCMSSGDGTGDTGNAPVFPQLKGAPIRAVSMAGVFVPTEWVTKPAYRLTLDEASKFYTKDDFVNMATLGVNTVLIPLPTRMIADDPAATSVLVEYLQQIGDAQLHAILTLEEAEPFANRDDEDATGPTASVIAAALFCLQHPDAVLGLQLPMKDRAMIDEVQKVAADLPLFLPINEGEVENFHLAWQQGLAPENIYASLQLSHTSNVADVASSQSQEDRSKLFYHEATSCIIRAPLDFAKCYGHNTQVFVSEGFDLSIDNCILKDIASSSSFKDYGQCDRFDETIDSPWWHYHRESYAARQLFAYEQGLGWSFAAWKRYDPASNGTPKTSITEPADLLSLQTVVAAGLFPNLNTHSPTAQLACLNPPESDFAMGDATYAPTLGPPPDCGNGWWNYTINDCSYWVPPPTQMPTSQPTIECPVCDDCGDFVASALAGTSEDNSAHGGAAWVVPAIIGALVGAVIAMAVPKLMGRRNRHEYTTIET